MTISCRDCGSIPKVPNAGEVQSLGGKEYQIMHNGLLVESGGYFGKWTETIIRELEGHHEPQEEKVFYEVLKLLQPGATMIELGSNWAYYSIWFNKCIPQGRNYCCEPNPESLKLGMRNAEANHCADIQFIQAAAGSDDGRLMIFPTGKVTVPIRSIDGIAREFGLEYVDIVHMDVQGAELDAIEGSVEAIQSKSVRFLFVSTHHYSISKDPLTHERCIALIEKLGGHILVDHAVHESFSGDGLIVASFLEDDKERRYDISRNRMKDSLFRSYSEDLDILINPPYGK